VILAALAFVAGFLGGAVWGMRRRSPSIFRLGIGVGGTMGLAAGLLGGLRLGLAAVMPGWRRKAMRAIGKKCSKPIVAGGGGWYGKG